MPGLSRALSLMKATSLGLPATIKGGLFSEALLLSSTPSPSSSSSSTPLRRAGHNAGILNLQSLHLRSNTTRHPQRHFCVRTQNPASLKALPEPSEEAPATPQPDKDSPPVRNESPRAPAKPTSSSSSISPERKRRGPLPDLLTVKGIGPRNMEKLVAKGIGKLVELKQLYREKFRTGGTEKLVEYLVASVGVHKNHANVIASFIKEAVDKEFEPGDEAPKSKKRFTFCVEGNISVGKTTFLQRIANETLELRDLVEVVPEPIAKWQDVGKDHFNVLDAFYAEPQRYAYTFQNYVFVTRLMQERESANGLKPLRLMERSVFSDRMVFVRAVHEAKWMSEMEISIYDSWFDPVVAELPGLVPDGFIYLRASPDACHRRLQMRKRPEEQKVTLDYLQGLHEKHEQWLVPTSEGTGSVMSLKEWQPNFTSPPARIKDRVFTLEGDHVHSSIRKVPALILDCEASIDFNKDVEAKAEYARQVADFFQYVKETRSVEKAVGNLMKPVDGGVDNLFLPARAKILGPDGLVFHP